MFACGILLLVNHKKTKNAIININKNKKTIVIAEKIRYTHGKSVLGLQVQNAKKNSPGTYSYARKGQANERKKEMKEKKEEKKMKLLPVLCFGLLMAGLGSSDSLRGIFAPVFQNRYGLSESQLSLMITISYIGNLLFLSVGGKLLDRFPRKRVAMGVTGIWVGAILLNLLTDDYGCIMISMFLALGASTLLNTTVNILTPSVCAGYAGLMVNVFFFIQGIGTSGSQYFLGRYWFSYEGWKGINGVLLGIGAAVLALLFFMVIPENSVKENTEGGSEEVQPEAAVFWMFAAMMGCYFIAEHGIMNWLLSYCINAFQMEASQASVSLSIFWAGMTAGRLLFAPVVQKLGAVKSLYLFGGLGTVMFCAGCLLGSSGILVLGCSGFAISILYPTMVLLIQQIYPRRYAATKTGAIISIATLADIGFNLVFGVAADRLGYRISFLILPVCMVGFYLLYVRLVKKVGKKAAIVVNKKTN